MRYDPEKHHRRSIRLQGYDYSTPGAYFVTIVTQGRESLFGQIIDGEMHLNDAGRMVERWWHELNRKFPNVRTDAYVIMPNHFHGIIQILPHPNGRGRPTCLPPTHDAHTQDVHAGGAHTEGAHAGADGAHAGGAHTEGAHTGAGGAHAGGAHTGAPLQGIVQWFKTMTTNEYIQGVKQRGWPPFDRRLWQRNYYEHIIRNEEDREAIRHYILTNPLHWQSDRENPVQEEAQP